MGTSLIIGCMNLDRIQEAIDQNVPILPAVAADKVHYRVWCDRCFIWHWHGRMEGMRVPHCPYAARWYYIVETGQDPAVTYATRAGSKWRAPCPKRGCNTHLRPTTGLASKPHYMYLIERPGPGSPVYCHMTGRFFDLATGEQVEPGYSDDEMIRYRYLPIRSPLVEHAVDTA